MKENLLPGRLLRTIDLLRATSDEFAEFRRRVGKNNGEVYVLVHPFYDEDLSTDETPGEYKNLRNEFIKKCLEEGLPLVIFEEYDAYPRLLERFMGEEGTLFVILTARGAPTPSIFGYGGQFPREGITIEPFRAAAVKHAIVGGKHMGFEKVEDEENNDNAEYLWWLKELAKNKPNAQRWLANDVVPGYCPGQVISWLLTVCDVSIFPISYPDKI